MIYYLPVILSVFCIAAQFSFTKLYESRTGRGIEQTAKYTMIAGIVSCFLFLAVARFKPSVSGFSVLMALLFASVTTASGILSLVAMSYGKMSVYTLFMMLGGMLLPFLYGAGLLKEVVSVSKWIGIALLVCSLLVPVLFGARGGKSKKRFYLLCAAVFLLNGAAGIVSKVHQISPDAVDTFSYLVFNYLFTFVLSAALFVPFYMLRRRRNAAAAPNSENAAESSLDAVKRDNTAESSRTGQKIMIKRQWMLLLMIAGYAVVSGAGYLLQLIGAAHLPASAMYPIVTGGTVVLTSLSGRIFFKEKLTLPILIGLLLTVVATVLFLF